ARGRARRGVAGLPAVRRGDRGVRGRCARPAQAARDALLPRIWEHPRRSKHPARVSMSIRTNEELDPNDGPSFTEFAVLASLFAIILLLIPVGVFTFSWPVWLLGLLMFIDLALLFLVSMTAVFLLRVFFADRRRGRGRTIGAAREPM